MTALFVKECSQVLKSLVYYIYVIVFVLFITSQMGGYEEIGSLNEPQPGQDYYGYGYSPDPQDIMEEALENLLLETMRNSYNTYPFGFIKVVTLNDEELREMEAELETACGRSYEELCRLYTDYWEQAGESSAFDDFMKKRLGWHIPVREDYAYEEFEKQMERVSGVIGKGCAYDGRYLLEALRELTYEDAKEEYDNLCAEDRITGAGMRLFCDYAGIVLGLLPVFVGVSVCLRDRRAKAAEVIASRRISGAALISVRYLAAVTLMFLPVAACAFLMQMPYSYKAAGLGVAPDQLAFLKYSFVWLFPMILFSTAVAFVLTELTDSVLAILVQTVWVLCEDFGADTIVGNFGLKFVPRWNEFGAYGRFAPEIRQLLINRGCYAALSLALVAAAILIYEYRRERGVTARGKIRKTRG